MKPNFVKTDNPKLDTNLFKLNGILTGINLDNLKYRMIGTLENPAFTDAVPNTSRLFKHGMNPRPWLCVPYTGDVWIASIDNENVDVRSTQSSMQFSLYVLG